MKNSLLSKQLLGGEFFCVKKNFKIEVIFYHFILYDNTNFTENLDS